MQKPMTVQEAGRLGGSRPKNFSPEEREKRAERMAKAREIKKNLRVQVAGSEALLNAVKDFSK